MQAQLAGNKVIKVPLGDDFELLTEKTLSIIKKDKPGLIFIANPNAPTGSLFDKRSLYRIIQMAQCPVVIDEAYFPFSNESVMEWLKDFDNLIVMRTFSKAWALAGIRCGYAIGETAAIRDFEKIRNHYGVNRMALVACEAALADQAYLAEVVRRVAAGRRRITSIAAANGLAAITSATNFVTIDCGRDGSFARRVLEALLARDVFVRKPMAPVLDRCIRVSVGRDEELDIFAEELPAALAAASAG